ncbi:deoxyguanosinetriphosphate triphosphohydrolase [Acidihalobacter aeolianus]|uniref:Deoxyguanosinetriphosphate triphosphohydrolase-like protein n=1 Tax=Acidihalobacter aeolianus TaxID=2792603 RepID=A0A1D8KB27_9GAMM|nr:deoxyguanosinetriphosphate triphosphohydrolase [Acidihalobacter aeolianus]AOV18161.1 deoxyguanosinetriphosphate triphosphohydrolase [Acidihalobacter aeolianus]
MNAAAGSLAPYAAQESRSRGRVHPELPPTMRGEFQRDRDRIIHSAAFRRLEYKTQVFINHEGDLYRTRLTHSLEVAQIARSAARALALSEDLTEAIALAHDLGHTPFGHAGQDALNHVMADFGGFEHNLQSLRVVDELEEKYAAFNGLNLCFETREGILKHCRRNVAARLGALGLRFLQGGQPSLEAQLTNLADEIAYNNHDIDDGLRAELISIEQLRPLPLFGEVYNEVTGRYPGLNERRLIHEIIRRMINQLVGDLVNTSLDRLREFAPADIDAVRELREPIIAFSPEMRAANLSLKRFLHEHLYRHARVRRVTEHAKQIVNELFIAYRHEPTWLPADARVKLERAGDETARARVVADYIAGMTDRFAYAEHTRIHGGSHV